MWSGEYWLGVHFSYTGAPMRRNSGYTRSASRAKAAWSPLLQAFNRLVISAEDSPDGHRCPLATKIYQNVAAFAVRFRLYHRKENKLSE